MHDLPRVQSFEFDEPQGREMLEFRLMYKGPLPSDQGGGNRAKYKHLIRKSLHRQLRELWKQHPALRMQAETLYRKVHQNDNGSWNVAPVTVYSGQLHDEGGTIKTWVEHIADDHQCAGGRWVPLVSNVSGFYCSLDVLFLRRDTPGGLVSHLGDVDNRIKTLFDGLQKAEKVSDLGGHEIDPVDENPFFCLLENDRLITACTVTTDRLLLPMEDGDKQHWVELVIDVKITNPNALFELNRL